MVAQITKVAGKHAEMRFCISCRDWSELGGEILARSGEDHL